MPVAASERGKKLATRIRSLVRDIPDFPQPGIVFKDITPVLAHGDVFRELIEDLAGRFSDEGIDRIAAIESRGFLFGAPIAVELGIGIAPIRKPGKLPHETRRVDYALEYGTDALEAHVDAFQPGERVLLVDDVLATGGTAAGAVRLIETLGATVVASTFLVELGFLQGRAKLAELPIVSVLEYGA